MVDMGAYEAQLTDCPAFPVTVPASASGLLTFAITCANSNGAGTNDVINLTNSTYTLTAVNNSDGGFANGLPAILDAATAGTLTINGNGATITRDGSALDFRLFYVNSGADLTLDNLTLRNGRSLDVTGGGAVRNQGTLTITNSTITNNLTNQFGGGINNSGTLAVTNSTFTGNMATDGGGINSSSGTTTISGSTFSGNTGTHAGGGISISGGRLAVTNSTFSGNTGTEEGGGINSNGGTLTVTNSTFTDNMAADGGGLAVFGGGTVTVTNSTFAENSATDEGSGVYTGNGTLTLNNSIVADSASGSNCYREGGTLNAHNSLIEDGLGCTNGTSSNNLTGDPALGFLTGSPAYYPLLDVSAAIDVGDDALAVDADSNPLTIDEAGSDRIQGHGVDMGAYEHSALSYVSISPDSASVYEGTNTDFTITRDGDTSSDLSVKLSITLGMDVTSDDYTFSGALSGAVSGSQIVTIPAGSASTTINFAALIDSAGAEADETVTIDLSLGSYHLDTPSSATATIPANDLTVTNRNDSGEGSLRQAVLNANAFSTDDTITFSISGNITVTGGQMTIANNGTLTIESGGGTVGLYSDGSDRLFYVESGADVTFNALRINTGAADNGGAIYNDGGTLTLIDSILAGNSATQSGGAIYNNGGTLTITNGTIYLNTATQDGGALYVGGGTLVITSSTFSGNSGNGGGAVQNDGGTLTITNSTIESNTASAQGGGILNNSGAVTLTNSTVAYNSAGGGGGVYSVGGAVTLNNSIVADSTSGGDCVLGGGTINAQNSLIGDGLSCVNGTNSNNLPGDPGLSLLTGTPAYYPLSVDSIAVNAGDNALAVDAGGSALTTDEAGNPRIFDGTVDMGAYEVQLTGCPTFPHTVAAGDVSDLIMSITCANATVSSDVINLTANSGNPYTLTAVNNSDGGIGNNGLPAIQSAAASGSLTINGDGATLTRDGSAPNFRLFYLSSGADLTLDNLTLSNGSLSSNEGGAIYNNGGTLTVTNSTLSGNTAFEGGGIYQKGDTLTVANSTFSGNSAATGQGGGIYQRGGTATVSSSTFSGNRASLEGSAIDNHGGVMTVINSTVTGGTYADSSVSNTEGTLTLTNSTIANNSSGGIYNANSFNLNNSIVANNSGGNCLRVSGTINAQNSLIKGGLGCVNGTNVNNLTGDPSLGTLTGSPAYYPAQQRQLRHQRG